MEKGGLTRANVVYDFPTAFDLFILMYIGKASLFIFETLMHSCYLYMVHPWVILGLRGMLNGMTNVDTIASK